MSSGIPVRRSQLIAPFGVGAMVTGPDGISLMTAGLESWFRREGDTGDSATLDVSEYRVDEWRLQRYLDTRELRLPPDYRRHRPHGAPSPPNAGLTVPMVRFPQQHFCRNPACLRLTAYPLHARGQQRCRHCQKGWVAQVPFVAICADGHIQDFPFREWAHKSLHPACTAALRLRSTGGASLSAQRVECDCGASRSLSGVTDGDAQRSALTDSLSRDDGPYGCPGRTPWHGTEAASRCGNPIKGSLRSASNVYYAVTRSSIFLPQANDAAVDSLLALFEQNPRIHPYLQLLIDAGQAPPPAATIRNLDRPALRQFTDHDIDNAASGFFDRRPDVPREQDSGPAEGETEFRRAEFDALCSAQQHRDLEIRLAAADSYGAWIAEHIQAVSLIDRLRETRALVGFERIVPETPARLDQRKRLLASGSCPWLPAINVYGEGIFIALREDRLRDWESLAAVRERAERLHNSYGRAAARRSLAQRELPARLLLLHTLAHVLINQLTFDCGYSSASLRERLYVSPPPRQMAGVLIYTAAGDSEGTMGGLVRMGGPGNLPGALARALENARWCSADPVCMEIGAATGQGPDSCNLAACHNCALVPETACEQFNRFLDRGALVGTPERPALGFFAERAP